MKRCVAVRAGRGRTQAGAEHAQEEVNVAASWYSTHEQPADDSLSSPRRRRGDAASLQPSCRTEPRRADCAAGPPIVTGVARPFRRRQTCPRFPRRALVARHRCDAVRLVSARPNAQTDAERYAVIEWDMLFTEPLQNFTVPVWDADISGKASHDPKTDAWPWFAEIERLPGTLKPHAMGISVFAGVMLSDACLAAVSEGPFPPGIFCELRVGTLSAFHGFRFQQIPAEKTRNLHWLESLPAVLGNNSTKRKTHQDTA